MADGLCVGRKDIICFLRPYLGLSPDIKTAWNMVRRWRKRYRLPVFTQPNGKPCLDPITFEAYWERYKELTGKKGLQGKSVILPKYHKTIPL